MRDTRATGDRISLCLHFCNHLSPIVHVLVTLPAAVQRLWMPLLVGSDLVLLLQLRRMMHRLRGAS